METQQDIAGDIEVDDLEQQADDQGEVETIDAVDALYGDEGQGDEQGRAEDEGEQGNDVPDEDAAPEIEPPHSWSKEDIENVWAGMTPQQQQVVQRRQGAALL